MKLDATRNDLSAVLLATVDFGFVFAGAQPILDKHLTTFLEILAAGKCELADDHDSVPFDAPLAFAP